LASQLTGWRIDIHSETKVRELEERAKRSLAEIDGVSEDLADTMFKLGWRSPEEVGNSAPEELVAIPGLGGRAAAEGIVAAAAVTAEIQRQRAQEEAARLAEERQKSDAERVRCVEGMTEELAQRLEQTYLTVEQVAKEHDMARMAEAMGLTVGRARCLHWAVRVYLGELDRGAPAPELDPEEEAMAAARAAKAMASEGNGTADDAEAVPEESLSERAAE
jgi:N utilization substance protein A